MDDFTRKFSIPMDKDQEIHQILSAVYQALEEKGYCIEQTTRKYLKAYGLSDDIIRRAIKRNTVN